MHRGEMRKLDRPLNFFNSICETVPRINCSTYWESPLTHSEKTGHGVDIYC